MIDENIVSTFDENLNDFDIVRYRGYTWYQNAIQTTFFLISKMSLTTSLKMRK